MYSRISFLSVFVLPILAVATPVARSDPTTACCASTIPADSTTGIDLIKGLGIILEDLTIELGLTCSPISVVGVGSGSECSGTTVSCSDGVLGGIGIGCVPITI